METSVLSVVSLQSNADVVVEEAVTQNLCVVNLTLDTLISDHISDNNIDLDFKYHGKRPALLRITAGRESSSFERVTVMSYPIHFFNFPGSF